MLFAPLSGRLFDPGSDIQLFTGLNTDCFGRRRAGLFTHAATNAAVQDDDDVIVVDSDCSTTHRATINAMLARFTVRAHTLISIDNRQTQIDLVPRGDNKRIGRAGRHAIEINANNTRLLGRNNTRCTFQWTFDLDRPDGVCWTCLDARLTSFADIEEIRFR